MHQKLISLVKEYQASKETLDFLAKIPLVIVAGISGAGKNTAIKELLKTNRFCYIVSYTTREPRINNAIKEVDGREYYFISEETAINMLQNQDFIEAAITHNHFYGTAIIQFREALQKHLLPISDIDVKGADLYNQARAINKAFFLLPPSLEAQIDRINNRYSQSLDKLDFKNRIRTSIKELEILKNRSYFIPIINNQKDETTRTMLNYLDHKKLKLNSDKEYKIVDKLIQDLRLYYKTL